LDFLLKLVDLFNHVTEMIGDYFVVPILHITPCEYAMNDVVALMSHNVWGRIMLQEDIRSSCPFYMETKGICPFGGS
jgi:hypothetical protein